MIQEQQGGGNILANQRIVVRRTAAIGDAVCATIVADKLKEQGYECIFQSHRNIHSVLRFSPNLASIDSPSGYAHCNLDGCYERNPNRRNLHFHDMFLRTAANSLLAYGINLATSNARPGLCVNTETAQIALAKFTPYERPWIFVVPRSNVYRVRQVPDTVWEAAVSFMPGTKFWLGLHPAPKGIVDIQCHQLENLVPWLSVADLIVSVDTGPAHVGIALGVRTILLGQSSSPELHFSDQRDFETIWPEGNLECLNCQQNLCPVNVYMPPCQTFDPQKIAQAVHRKLSTKISAVIPTYKADAHNLSKCLDNVVPQVDEVILTAAADALIPDILMHPKVRVVRHRLGNLGFGKNVNFGMRHTSGQWVMLLNDDCYLNGDCLEQLKTLCAPDVGMIAHLLRYPTGAIYFAGRQRRNGERGFPHIDHMQYLPRLSTVSEMEAVSGTSVLINREAFYKIGGFDERFFMYAEDDDISMRMRQAGYRLLYHPTALGIHEGSATTKRTHNVGRMIQDSGKLMEQLWGWYWDKNRNRVPGVFK